MGEEKVQNAVTVLRRAALSVAGVFGYALLVLIQYCALAAMAARRTARRWRHRLKHVDLNSASGYAALVALRERTQQLADKPRNVGLLVLEDTVELEAVAKLILWCLAVGVETVSAYDINGTLLQKLGNLEEIMQNTLVDARCRKSAVTFVVGRVEAGEDATTGAEKPSGMPVYVLTAVDGKRGLVDAFRKICDDYKFGVLGHDDVNQTTLDKYIKAQHRGMPEPQLAIRFGGSGSVLGYPPWHINYSEILDLGSHRDVLLSEFIEVLEAYDTIEKRFGK